MRYIAAVERGGHFLVLMRLPNRQVHGHGQGGGGALSDDKLFQFIFSRSGPPRLRPGSIVHTDAARAYRSLAWCNDAAAQDAIPPPPVIDTSLNVKPTLWRYERYAEVVEREAAERRETAPHGRNEYWTQKYADLRLAHTAVCHKFLKRGGMTKRQFVAMRRVVLPPEIADAIQGNDPFLHGNVTWMKGGTQTADGYWKTLRRRSAQRGINTSMSDALHRVVLVHLWSYNAGPDVDLLAHLGRTLQCARRRRDADVAAVLAAWEDIGECETEENQPSLVWQQLARAAAVARGEQLLTDESLRRSSQVARSGQLMKVVSTTQVMRGGETGVMGSDGAAVGPQQPSAGSSVQIPMHEYLQSVY